jgi:NodT family efflux transporter outer membrane factor (OMF) lipoprotein
MIEHPSTPTRPSGAAPNRPPSRRVHAATGGAAIAAILAASGCKVGPNYERPEAQVNDAWQQSQSASAESAAANIRWWESFNDPTLTALVKSAYAQNLTLRQAGLRVLEARAARGIAVGNFFPQLQEATGGLGANQISKNDAPTPADRSFANANIGLQAAWELDFWGKFRRGIEASDAEVLATVADYDTVLITLAAGVATDYIIIRSLEERLVYANANVKLQADTLALTQIRFKAGAVSELDVSTARSTLANTQALIPDLNNQLLQTKMALCLLLGRTPSELQAELGTDPAVTKVPEAPAQIAAGVPAELLRRRPDIRSAERFAAAQSARIGQAVSDLYPRISINGATGFVATTYNAGGQHSDLGSIFDANSFAGFIGLQVNWPILNYGRIESNIQVQDARYEEAVSAYQESVLRAAGEVESGLSDFLQSKLRTGFLAEAVDASQRSTELSLIQYRAGAVDFIRVNNAQTDLVQQQDNLVVARAAIALGAVRTYRALGGGWEIREGQEFVDPATVDRLQKTTDWGEVVKPDWQKGKDLGFERPSESTTKDNEAGGNK